LGSVFFISDAHLGFDDPEVERRREHELVSFLDWILPQAEILFIVGDLFDFWFEYGSVIPRKHFQIVFALHRLRRAGVSIQYVMGNHDGWAETFFPDELGIPMHAEPVTPTLRGKRFYIGHGDGFAKKDVGYRIMKKVIRNPMAVRMYKWLHPDVAFRTALFFSRLSRNHRPIRDRDDEYAAFAKALFSQGFDHVVLGHTHRPFTLTDSGHTYINTGDWMNHFTFGRFDDDGLTLEHWPVRVKPPGRANRVVV